jgi:hypothetical protein
MVHARGLTMRVGVVIASGVLALAACSGGLPNEEPAPEPLPTREPRPKETAADEVCIDPCDLGARECAGDASFKVCERDGDCPTWRVQPCADGTACDSTAMTACLGEDPPCPSDCEQEGVKRCSDASGAEILVCQKTAEGCLRWSPHEGCPEGASCAEESGEATCKPGCTDDPGCSSDTVGQARCVNGTSDQVCQKEGLCHRWRTRQTAPAECSGAGAFACSGDSARRICQTFTVGACTGRRIVTAQCPAGTKCSGAGVCGSCNDTGCDATTAGTYRCKPGSSTARQRCQLVDGCHKWTDATSCSGARTCSAGACTCSGCISGALCYSGTTAARCGTGGAVCRDCAAFCAQVGQTSNGCTATGRCDCRD